MKVRIYRPAKNAMQSGTARTHQWIMESVDTRPRSIDPVMGWTSSADTRQQLRMYFDSKDAAVAFAQENGYDYELRQPHQRVITPKSYADNFAFQRIDAWSLPAQKNASGSEDLA